MSHAPLEVLLSELDREFERDPKGARVARRLETYAREHEDWRDYALFDELTYARNLVRSSAVFELLVICWRPGQASPIHNHQGQRCWMGVLDGEISETLFHAGRGSSGPLSTGATKTFERGSVAFITDEIALHEIRPAGRAPGVTLHLYSRPIRECQVYDRDSGHVALRRLAYYSIGGVRRSAPA